MARGLSREQSKEKNAKAAASANKGNQEGISSAARAERDAKKLQEKQAANAAKKADALAAGGSAAEQALKEEAAKAAQRAAKKERAYTNTQAAKVRSPPHILRLTSPRAPSAPAAHRRAVCDVPVVHRSLSLRR